MKIRLLILSLVLLLSACKSPEPPYHTYLVKTNTGELLEITRQFCYSYFMDKSIDIVCFNLGGPDGLTRVDEIEVVVTYFEEK